MQDENPQYKARHAKAIGTVVRGMLFVLLLLVAPALLATDSQPLPAPLHAYEAEYRVTRGPLTLGRAVTRLEPHALGWQYETVTTATGVALMLVSGDAIERTVIETEGDHLRPLLYFQRVPNNGDARVRFNWRRDTATVNNEDGRQEVDITPGMHDPNSALLVLMQALANGADNGGSGQFLALDIIDDDGDIKSLGFSRVRSQEIEVAFGRFETILVRLVRDDRPKRETLAWFAPELGWIPIRLEQRDKGSLVARLELRTLNGEEGAQTAGENRTSSRQAPNQRRGR